MLNMSALLTLVHANLYHLAIPGTGILLPEQMNPQLGDGLAQYAVINVPSKAILQTAIAEKGYTFYQVQPKEGFYRLKVKTNLTKEQIIALNPYAKDGLQDGMILKIPTNAITSLTGQINIRDLQQTIIDTSQKRIAVLLPFRLNKIISEGRDPFSLACTYDLYFFYVSDSVCHLMPLTMLVYG